MARGNGKRYDETFKKETVKYITEKNKPVAQVVREVGVNDNILHGWVKKYGVQPEIKAVKTISVSFQRSLMFFIHQLHISVFSTLMLLHTYFLIPLQSSLFLVQHHIHCHILRITYHKF